MRIALDTNIVIYAEHLNDAERAGHAARLLDGLRNRDVMLPSQALGEFYFALSRKFRFGAEECRKRVEAWRLRYPVIMPDEPTFFAALDLATAHHLQFWDALILATAAEARCRLLLSEDLADGFVHRGCTVADPFGEKLHPLLADALDQR